MRRRPQSTPALHGFAPVALAAAVLVVAACERHIDEPVPVRPLDPTSVVLPPPLARTADTPTLQTAAPVVPKERCVRPSPAVAKRATPKSPDPRCPKDPETPPKLHTGTVTFADAKAAAVRVEIVEKDHDRQRGLMYRTSMPADRGMIFVFDRAEDHAFWMHNTCIPLDMIYIADDGLIVGIEENTPTISDDTFDVGCPSKYVLEVNAGWTRAHGVKAGQSVKIDL